MKSPILYYAFFLILIACSDDEVVFVDIISDKVVKYVLYMSDNKIQTFDKFVNDELVITTDFLFDDEIVVKSVISADNKLLSKCFYYMNGNATNSIDSVFKNSQIKYVSQISYDYLNDSYLQSFNETFFHFDSCCIDTILLTHTFSIKDGNINADMVSCVSDCMPCTDRYAFNSLINKIDIENFSNNITGKINRNLISHIYWHPDCHTEPSTSTPESEYSYELNENGYVIKKNERIIPGFHSLSKEVEVMVNTTLFEYYFQ